MMDSAIAVDRKKTVGARGEVFRRAQRRRNCGGQKGVRVVPVQRSTSGTDVFQFINANIGADEPKSAVIRELAHELEGAFALQAAKIAVVVGPAVVRTGAGEHLERVIKAGYVQRLFAGNAFAAY